MEISKGILDQIGDNWPKKFYVVRVWNGSYVMSEEPGYLVIQAALSRTERTYFHLTGCQTSRISLDTAVARARVLGLRGLMIYDRQGHEVELNIPDME